MRRPRRAALTAPMTIIALGSLELASAPAAAQTAGPTAPRLPARPPGERPRGGTQAPSAPAAGGAEYGVLTLAPTSQRPVVRELNVPSAAPAGRPPHVTLQIDEPGVGTVSVRVAVVDLSTRRPVLVVQMGWVHTGRRVSVSWPRGARLRPGSYHVSLTAHDHHSGALLRRAHASGVATLTVTAPPRRLLVAPPPSTSAPEAGVPTPAQLAAEGAVFPVAGPHSYGGPENRFGAPRAGYVHQGQDVLTAEGTTVLAPLAGEIVTASYQAGGAGYYAVLHTRSGFDFMFAHCEAGSLAAGSGQTVAAGQQLCRAGQTGDATGPHVHVEMWVGGWRTANGHPIDPLPYLQALDRSGPAG
jgi:Peptidase family M23